MEEIQKVYFRKRISKILDALEKKQYDQIKLLKRISPIAWIHILLYGKYDFTRKSYQSIVSNISEVTKDVDLV